MILNGKYILGTEQNVGVGKIGIFAGDDDNLYIKLSDGTVLPIIAGTSSDAFDGSYVKIDGSNGPYENFNFSSGEGIDSNGILNVGNNSNIINIGGSGTLVNIFGTTSYINSTNLEVSDQLITLNKGGSTASGFGSGFAIEENGSLTGYIKVNNTRDGYLIKSLSSTYSVDLSLSTLTSDRTFQFPNLSGTLALTSDIPVVTGFYLPLSGGSMSGVIVMNNNNITGIDKLTGIGSINLTNNIIYSDVLATPRISFGSVPTLHNDWIVSRSLSITSVTVSSTPLLITNQVGGDLLRIALLSGNRTFDLRTYYHYFSSTSNQFTDGGDTASVNPNSEILRLNRYIADTTGNRYGFSNYTYPNPSSNSTANYSGAYFQMYIWKNFTHGNVANIKVDNYIREGYMSGVTNFTGISIRQIIGGGAGSSTYLLPNHFYIRSEANNYGVATSSITVTNNYFLHNANNNMFGTNKWFLYNEDPTVNSYLNGQLTTKSLLITGSMSTNIDGPEVYGFTGTQSVGTYSFVIKNGLIINII